MKRWLCLALSLLMLAVWLPASAESTDWNYDANYAILRGYDGAGGDVVVPAEIDGFTVDVIGVSVFKGDTITSLTLPETVLELRSNGRRRWRGSTTNGCRAYRRMNRPRLPPLGRPSSII